MIKISGAIGFSPGQTRGLNWGCMKSEWRGEVQQVAQRQFLCHQTLNHTKAYHGKILAQHYIFNWLLFNTFFHPCKVSFINDLQSANVAIPFRQHEKYICPKQGYM